MSKESRKSELRTQKVCVVAGVEQEQPTSPIKAIRAFCLECMGGSMTGQGSIETCRSKNRCPLWPFRFGKNPFSTKGDNMTDEQRQAAADRLKKTRDKNNEVDEDEDDE